MKVKDREVPSLDGRQTLKMFGTFCIVPKGMKVVEMWPTTPYILGSMTPAYTWGDKIRVNPDLFLLIDVKILVEECIHGYQYRRMNHGWGFFPTYIWHIVLDVFRKRRELSIHNANMMEREAMDGAKAIVNAFQFTGESLDIEKEIKKYFGW
jgi:hypothetical protein